MFPRNSVKMLQEKELILQRAVFAESIMADGLYKLLAIFSQKMAHEQQLPINPLQRNHLILRSELSPDH